MTGTSTALSLAALIPLLLSIAACAGGPDYAQLDAIRALEAQRSGRDELMALCGDPDRDIRRAACEALGHLADPAVEPALERCVRDDDTSVVRAAAFALGRMEHAGGSPDLNDALEHADPAVRLLAARALGHRLALDAVPQLLDLAGTDPSATVRAAAATALGELVSDRRGPRAIADAERATVAGSLAARLDVETHAATREMLAYALAEAADPSGSDAARRALESIEGGATDETSRWTRIFALRALARSGTIDESELLRFADDSDPQLAFAALAALGRRPAVAQSAAVWTTCARLATDGTSAHVRARALQLAASNPAPSGELATLCATLTADPSPTVRRAALEVRARQDPTAAMEPIDVALGDPDFFERAAAVHAARRLPTSQAHPRLARALEDPVPAVRAAAVQALADHPQCESLDDLLGKAATDRDLAMREELATTLTALAPGRATLARAAFLDRPGSEYAEARKLLLAALVACDPTADGLDSLLERALRDPDLAVRLEAARQLRARHRPVPDFDPIDRGPFPRVGDGVPPDFLSSRPVLELQTTRGPIVIALAPALAPVHCWSLCQLAASGRLDGRAFHRVVGDFVVQGGDERDDGYGNRSWLDGTLRAEINPLPFLAGTLGMPRTAEPDSGGGQLFLTLGPTPWLDGRYTALGRITSGLAVAELIEVGDRIVTARVSNR